MNEREETKTKIVLNKYKKPLVIIIGILLIVAGLLTVIIPSMVKKDFRLVKNNEDVTSLYLSASSKDDLSKTYYSLNNPNEDKYFSSLSEDGKISIDLKTILENNQEIYPNSSYMIEINFDFDVENYSLYQEDYNLVSYPEINLTFGDYYQESFTFNYFSFSTGEIYLENVIIDNLNDFNLSLSSTYIEISNNKEIKKLDILLEDIKVEVFKEV